MKCKKFWECVKSVDWLNRLSQIVTIGGIIGIFIMLSQFNKQSKQEQANEIIIEAVAICNAANDIAD